MVAYLSIVRCLFVIVNFRVVVVNPQMMPYTGECDVEIKVWIYVTDANMYSTNFIYFLILGLE